MLGFFIWGYLPYISLNFDVTLWRVNSAQIGVGSSPTISTKIKKIKIMTPKQKIVITKVINIISSWKHTNDINSPTHYSDIKEELRLLDELINDEEFNALDNSLTELLNNIQDL